MNYRRLLATAICALLTSTQAGADLFLGLGAGASAWNAEFSGEIGDDPQKMQDLGFDDDHFNSLYAEVELFALPELRIAQTHIDSQGTSTLNSDFDLGGLGFPAGTEVTSEIDLTTTDATLYWQVLDNITQLDLGLTARYMEGDVVARSNSDSDRVEVAAVVPMGFARARFDLPFSGWYLLADAQLVRYQGDSLSDLSAAIGWQLESLVDLGINAGYRQARIDIEDLDGLTADVELSGPFASLIFHF